MSLTPREYTLHRIVILGLEVKAKYGRDDYRVGVLRDLYKEVKADSGSPRPYFAKARHYFIGLDVLHLDRILVEEEKITELIKRI
jgi:uncharacterized membrane protein YjdF